MSIIKRKMKRNNKILLYSLLLLLGLAVFILEIFIFQKPDGVAGLFLCLASIYLIVGSIIKLCKLSERFAEWLPNVLDLLFWLP